MGAFVKPFRTYLSNKTLRRIRKHLHEFQNTDISKLQVNSIVSMVNSYIGVFSHYKSFNLKKDLFINTPRLDEFGSFIEYYEKFVGKED